MTIVIIQCRLGSTRLPSKALLPLGNKTCIEWTLSAMKKVSADAYYVATDQYSFAALQSLAQKNGWECFAGSEHNVLERFCSLIEHVQMTHNDKVTWAVRATGDNPFLFYEAAQSLLEETLLLTAQGQSIDYTTYVSLPHGSGIEILNAQSLLQAQKLTSNPYDTEHVGPALYNHTDRWNCRFIPSPAQWSFPQYRTTIDTYSDYRRALRIVQVLQHTHTSADKEIRTLSYDQILYALQHPSVSHPVLCVPQTDAGFGTGHARRMLNLASKLGADLFIPEKSSLPVKNLITTALEKDQISSFQILQSADYFQEKKAYDLIVTDYFRLNEELLQKLKKFGPVISIDEGIRHDVEIDFLIEIIPSLHDKKCNLKDILLLDLPRREVPRNKNGELNVLICIGGEDPAQLSFKAALSCAQALHSNAQPFNMTVINNTSQVMEKKLQENFPKLVGKVSFVPPIPNLSFILQNYDLIISHYGLTAFEAVSLDIPLILLGTTKLHTALAKKYGFYHITPHKMHEKSFQHALKNINQLKTAHSAFKPLYEYSNNLKKSNSLSSLIQTLSKGTVHYCPLCIEQNSCDKVIGRTENKTVRRCRRCGMLYPSWICGEALNYDASYFFEEYKKQYGKTYLEDFEQIKSAGIRRLSHIKSVHNTLKKRVPDVKVLDVGCAYGPFLQAAKESGFLSFGTDISTDAANYVKKNLGIPSCVSAYPEIDIYREFNVHKFDVVSMWFVIEHFQNLDAVLKKTWDILNDGGVFAFSTPNGSGVSRTFWPIQFFTQSPLDHFTIWELRKCRKILNMYGFRVKKIVCTGHHAERFPFIKRFNLHKGSILFSLCTVISMILSLGDTFEVYCIKSSNKL